VLALSPKLRRKQLAVPSLQLLEQTLLFCLHVSATQLLRFNAAIVPLIKRTGTFNLPPTRVQTPSQLKQSLNHVYKLSLRDYFNSGYQRFKQTLEEI
jgi:hypothetical protein